MGAEGKLVDLELNVVAETERAFGFWTGKFDKHGRKQAAWVPKSVVEDNGDGTFTMPYRAAYERGLI